MSTIESEFMGFQFALEDAIPDVLAHEVSDELKETISAQTYPNVYDAYQPKMWSRRGRSGGLADPSNMVALVNGNELVVRSEVPLQSLFAHTVAAYTHNSQKANTSTAYKTVNDTRKRITFESSLSQVAQGKKITKTNRNAFNTSKKVADHSNLAEIVESGAGYNMPFPRPYHEDAENMFRTKADSIFGEALQSALHARGY